MYKEILAYNNYNNRIRKQKLLPSFVFDYSSS